MFAVRPMDDKNPNAANPLPETAVDMVAATIPRLTSYTAQGARLSTARTPTISSRPSGSHDPVQMGGFEDEDLELQRALQASLAESGVSHLEPGLSIGGQHDVGAIDVPDQAFAAFQASMARQRDTLAHARREQEEAMRETLQNEVSTGTARRRQTAGEEEEEEMMRRALEESMGSVKGDLPELDVPAEEDDPLDADASPPVTPLHRALRDLPPPTQLGGPRNLDDEDAELQAALRASLENVPDGFVVPESPPPVHTGSRVQPAVTTSSTGNVGPSSARDDVEAASVTSSPVAAKEEIDLDEMRKRRLARFGG